MADGAKLAEAVWANPDDVEARLVYGDWLVDSGDPRGTFIVSHCKLETMSGLEDEYAPLRASTERLEAKHAPTWLEEYAERMTASPDHFSRIEVSPLFNPVFRSGFLHRIAAVPSDVSTNWDWLREREPVQGMELLVGEGVDPDLDPKTSEWKTLKLSPDDWFTAGSFGRVLAWGFPSIQEIDLSGCDLGIDGAHLLTNAETTLGEHDDQWVAPPPLPTGQLRSLALRNTAIGDEGARLLFAADTLSDLTTLDISQCRIKETETLEALRDAPLTQLRALSLAGNKDLGGKLAALAGWKTLLALRELALPQTVTAGDIEALFPQPSAELRGLDLAAAKELLKSPEIIRRFANSLTSLNIGLARIGDGGFTDLLGQPIAARLHTLRAYGSSLSDKSIAALVESDLKSLVVLDLSSNKLTDKSLRALAEWPGLATITQLRLGNNRKLSAGGYSALIDADAFDPVSLDVGSKPPEEAIAPLRERFGDVLIGP